MVNIALGWRPFKTTFAGEEVTIMIRPLKRGAFLALAPLFYEWTKVDEKDQGKVNEMTLRLWDAGKDIIPDHVESIKGITIDDKPMAAQQLIDESIFKNLAIDVMTALVKISQVNLEDKKKLGSQSEQTPNSEQKQTPDLSLATP